MGNVEANPKGYPIQVFVTNGHEAEALASQEKKRQSRIGMFILKVLGFRPEQPEQPS
jgi:hypothetical protein